MRADHRKFVLWGGPLELVLVVLGILAWVCFPHRYIHRYPPEVRTAMRVAVGAWSLGGGPEQSVKRYLEAQFGSLTFATNREKAFLSFLNPNQITAYHLLMKHAPANENKANAAAAARWVAEYRRNLSPAEKSALRGKLTSPAGQAMVQQGTTQFETLSADFRGVTAPVFLELLATLKTLKTE